MVLGIVLLAIGSVMYGMFVFAEAQVWSRRLWVVVAWLTIIVGVIQVGNPGGSWGRGAAISVIDGVVFCTLGWFLVFCVRRARRRRLSS
jgi:hypothetical protein